jgi:fused signal recognition particle receptor
MNELTKVKACDAKVVIEAPHDVLLVLWINWSKRFEQGQFTAATEVTSRGNKIRWYPKAVLLLEFQISLIPVKYIGVGEGIEDLQVFNKHEFV